MRSPCNQVSHQAHEIRLKCRESYGIDGMWQNLGYVYNHKEPAKTKGQMLKVWSRQTKGNNQLSLFSRYDLDDDRIVFAIDAFTLQKLLLDNKESDILEWLRSFLNVVIVDEVFNEIEQYIDDKNEMISNIIRSNFSIENIDHEAFNTWQKNISNFVKKEDLQLLDSNIRVIAKCLAAEKYFLISENSKLLENSRLIYQETAFQIISLEQAIKVQQGERDNTEHQPILLENKNVKM